MHRRSALQPRPRTVQTPIAPTLAPLRHEWPHRTDSHTSPEPAPADSDRSPGHDKPSDATAAQAQAGGVWHCENARTVLWPNARKIVAARRLSARATANGPAT